MTNPPDDLHSIGAIGEYRLTERLGSGRHGEAFLAVGPAGQVLIKALLPERCGDPGARAALAAEAAAMKAATWPFAPELFDVDLKGERPHLIREFVSGPTVEEYLKRQGPLKEAAATRLALQSTALLRGLHANGVAHGDFRTRNIVIGELGLMAIDFGRSVLAADSRRAYRKRCTRDMLSLGRLIIEVGTGEPAFGDDPDEIIDRFLAADANLGTLSGSLRRVARSCIRKQAWRRPSAATAFRRLT